MLRVKNVSIQTISFAVSPAQRLTELRPRPLFITRDGRPSSASSRCPASSLPPRPRSPSTLPSASLHKGCRHGQIDSSARICVEHESDQHNLEKLIFSTDAYRYLEED